MKRQLYKSNRNKMLAGVCGGIAEYFDIDATIVRLVFGIVTLFWGTGIIVYILAAFIIPSAQENDPDDVENLKSANIDDENEGGSKTEKSRKREAPHSDDEFDSYFKK